MVIAHNIFAMNAQRQLNIVTKNKEKTTEKLSSGYRINRAADDAAGLSISEKMRRQIRGLSQGIKNTEDGVSLCQVADGALAEVSDMLHRITELSIKSANGTNSDEDRKAIQQEISQIMQEIDRIGDTTEFNERKIFRENKSYSVTGGSSGITNSGGVSSGSGTSFVTKERTLDVTVKGTPTDSSAATYNITADETTGVHIGAATYLWSDIKNANGDSLGDAVIQEGTYAILHKGMTMEINVSKGQTLDNIASKLNGLSWSSTEKIVSRETAVDNLKIVPHKKIATYTTSNYPKYNYIYADENGLKVNSGNVRTWTEMGIDLDNPVIGTYTFSDPSSEVEFTFDIKEDATKSGVIAGLNNVVILTNTLYEADFTACAVGFSDCYFSPMQTGNMWGDQKTAVFSKTDGSSLDILNKSGYQEYFEFREENGKLGLRYLGGSTNGPFNLSTSKDLFFKISTESENYLKNWNYSTVTGVADWKSNPIVFEHGESKIYFGLRNNGTGSVNSYADLVAEATGASNLILSFGSDYFGVNHTEVNVYAEDTYGVKSQAFGNIGKINYAVTLPDTILLNDKETYKEEVVNPPLPPVDKPTDPDDNPTVKTSGIWIQSGSEAGQGMWLEIDPMNTTILGINDLDVSSVDGANHALDAVKGALEKVSSNRSKIGAQQNRLEHTIANELNVVENTTSAESRIRDTDMSKEMVAFSKDMILENVGQAMLAQANQSNQGVLSLLQ